MNSWRNMIVSLVLAVLIIGLGMPSVSVGAPPGPEPLGPGKLNMNDDISWKDADSYRRLGPDYTMDMEVAVLWNDDDNRPLGGDGWGDYAQVEEYRGLWNLVDASIYCFGTYDPYDPHGRPWSEVALWVRKGLSGPWVREPGIKACSDHWETLTWTVDLGSGGSYETYFRFVLYRHLKFLKFGPKASWSPDFTHDDGAVIEIDPHADPTKWDANYYFMTGTTFSDVDSCRNGHPTCDEWHSQVNNHVVFTEYNDYFQTREFSTSGSRVYFDLHAKCLTSLCMIDIQINGIRRGIQGFVGGWMEHRIWEEKLPAGNYVLKIVNMDYAGGDSHFAWDYVEITE